MVIPRKRKEHIMNPSYMYIGVGFADNYWAQHLLTNVKSSENNENAMTLSVREYEEEVIRLTNIEREKAGLSHLEIFEPAMENSRNKSIDMVTRNYKDHVDPDGNYMVNNLYEYGEIVAENIAVGSSYIGSTEINYLTPEEALSQWLSNDWNRENIFNPAFKYVGVGFHRNLVTQQLAG